MRATLRMAWLAALAAVLLLARTGAAQERGAPPAPAGHLERAEAAFGAGRYVEALEESRRAAEAAPTSLRAVLARASMAEFMGEFDEARAVYDKAAARAPDDPAVLYRRASFAVRVGEYDRALALLDRLLAMHPGHVRWLFHWAPSLVQPWLLRQNPSLEQIVQIEIDVLTEKGDLERARQLAWGYRVVTSGRDYCGEARAKAGAGPERILQAYRLSTLAQPGAADCIWWYGQWLTDEGYVTLGRLMVKEGTRATPSEANKASGALYLRIRLGGDRPLPKRAEQLFLIARQRYLRDGDLDGATRLFDEAIRLAPGFARPYNYRAFIAWDLGDREGAVAWLERALQADRDSWRTHRNLGRLLEELERYPDAEGHLRTAVGLFPDDAGGRLLLARALYAEGKYDEYVKETRAAVDFFGRWGQPLPEVRAFLGKFERWGPGASLPPTPDPPIIMGWNHD